MLRILQDCLLWWLRKHFNYGGWSIVCRIVSLCSKPTMFDAKARPWSKGLSCTSTQLTINLEGANDCTKITIQHCSQCHAARSPHLQHNVPISPRYSLPNQRMPACQIPTPPNILDSLHSRAPPIQNRPPITPLLASRMQTIV